MRKIIASAIVIILSAALWWGTACLDSISAEPDITTPVPVDTTAEEPPQESPVDMIKLPMVQCLNRAELKGLMGQCWDDAATINRGNTVEGIAFLAAAIFAVRADNIQSGKEAYVREWAVNREDQK